MPYSNYANGFQNGVSIREVPLVMTPNPKGEVFWVNSSVGNASDNNKGTNQYPLATLSKAISLCSTGRGDTIMVAQGHTETITSAVSINKANVEIIGLGNGRGRPVITFATATAASLSVDAANVSIYNMVFLCNIASQVTMIDVNSTYCTISRCEMKEGTATGLNFIDIDGGAANACDGAVVDRCKLLAPTAGNYDSGVNLGEVAADVVVSNNYIAGDFDNSGIYSASILTNLSIENNIVHNNQTGQFAIELTAAATGNLSGNYLYTDAALTTLDPGSLKCNNNFGVNAIDTAGAQIP